MASRDWLVGIAVALIAAGCATGVEDEPTTGIIADDGGTSLPDGAGGGGGGGGDDGGKTVGPEGCPGDMVKIPAGNDTYCVDVTEVTNEAYAKFLDAKPSISNQPAQCKWNTSFTPGSFPPATGEEKFPVVEVDWCDARAYCAWANKRLCGRIGEGELLFGDYADAKKSQWFNACSKGGALNYPYGNGYEEKACNGNKHGADAVVEAGSLASCEVSGIFDLSGNVLEWEDACDGGMGENDRCRIRGGSYLDDITTLRCDYNLDITRNKALPNVGFRCCKG